MWKIANTTIKLALGDITTYDGDAIVNAANTDLKLGSGVAGAIRVSGGPTIQEECDKIGPIGLGEAAITRAGNLKVKYVIHAASMHIGGKSSVESLKKSIWNSLLKGRNYQIRTLAFPAIGSGIGGIEKTLCAHVMVETFKDFVHTEPNEYTEIVVFLFNEEDYNVFNDVFSKALRDSEPKE
ncbi:MAG: macro domain-containing protein [Candidatus Heimdallarchaeaceae archaeon]